MTGGLGGNECWEYSLVHWQHFGRKTLFVSCCD